jgi:hypothetical protein
MSNGQNAVEIPENHAFDVDVLEKFLKVRVISARCCFRTLINNRNHGYQGVPSIGLKGNLAAKKFDYGQSNPTFLLESTEYHDGADPSQRWVMRKVSVREAIRKHGNEGGAFGAFFAELCS